MGEMVGALLINNESRQRGVICVHVFERYLAHDPAECDNAEYISGRPGDGSDCWRTC